MIRVFRLVDGAVRRRSADYILTRAPEESVVRVSEAARSLDQSARFHALCADLERSRYPWAGKPRKSAEWKVLLVSGHAIATKAGADMVPGLESEFVNLRESTARMTKGRMSSLIEYSVAWCAAHEIDMTETAEDGL